MTGPPEPWLSVVMPTYNGARYVAQALDSVRREPLDGVEIVVVDDGSTDETLAILEQRRATLPLRIVRQPRVGNWVAASNVGLREARGRWSCFLHQDDLWLAGRLAAVRREIERDPGFTLLLHPAVFVGPDGRRLGPWRCPLRAPGAPAEQFIERLLVQNFVAIPCPVFDREEALRSGALDETLWYTADWDLWLRLGAKHPVRYVDTPLAAFRIHEQSQTVARPRSADAFLQQMTTVLDRHLPTAPVNARRRPSLERVARFSAFVNAALAAAARGEERVPLRALAAGFMSLGPAGWRRYVRDSRILERVGSRVRLGRRLTRAATVS